MEYCSSSAMNAKGLPQPSRQKFIVQCSSPHLYEEVYTALGPPHRQVFYEPFAHHLLDRGLDKAGHDAFSVVGEHFEAGARPIRRGRVMPG